ncbi:Pentapeptide repeat family protein [hydrothermal vent metagenome]|uniref:Pentapeptide repeat family protein n=1 Tax=hydrothermal vent metagenome TaxID=652676 RepID=A0A3B1BMU6_9ZZZZ
MTKHSPLYVRKNGKVLGPFPPRQISQSLLLGRFRVSDDVSEDRENWVTIQSRPDLLPEVLQEEEPRDELAQERLMAARRWADERRPQHGNYAELRRSPEPDDLLEYRSHRESVYKNFLQRHEFSVVQALLVLLMVSGLIYAGFHFSPEIQIEQPDCAAAAAPGVNWRNCRMAGLQSLNSDLQGANLDSANLNGANLFGSNLSGASLMYTDLSMANLSYVDFRQAHMKGSNLQRADLSYADFTGADLSYADFSGAKMQEVRFAGARLDNAIWVDGRTCLAGSVGECRRVQTVR